MIGALLLLAMAAQAEPNSTALTAPRIVPRCDTNGAGEDIVVCGQRERNEQFRLPLRPNGFDKKGPVDSVSRERNGLIEEGDFGVGSCSTTGPGGASGCFAKSVKRRCEQETCGFSF